MLPEQQNRGGNERHNLGMERTDLEKLLRRKQRYLLAASLDQVSDPVQHACLRLFLAYCRPGIKLIVKRNIGRGSGYCQRRTRLRRIPKLDICLMI